MHEHTIINHALLRYYLLLSLKPLHCYLLMYSPCLSTSLGCGVWGVVEECRILHFPLTGCHVTFRTKTLVHTMYKTRHHWLHGPPYLEAVDCSSLLVMAYLAKRRSRVKRCACMEDWTNNMPSLEGMLFG